jgi:integrase-like protein
LQKRYEEHELNGWLRRAPIGTYAELSGIGIEEITVPCASFLATLKTECFQDKIPKNRAEARAMLFDYIESFYNPKCIHSALGYLSPMEFEKRFIDELNLQKLTNYLSAFSKIDQSLIFSLISIFFFAEVFSLLDKGFFTKPVLIRPPTLLAFRLFR